MANRMMRLLPDGDKNHGWKSSNLTSTKLFTTEDHKEMICEYFANEDEGVLAGVP